MEVILNTSINEHEVLNSCNMSVIEDDMNVKIHCAACGKLMRYGDGFTSKLISDECGFGYTVCRDCYIKERHANCCTKDPLIFGFNKVTYNRFKELRLQLYANHVRDLRVYPEFTLQNSYTTVEGDHVPEIHYSVEFYYEKNEGNDTYGYPRWSKIVEIDVSSQSEEFIRMKYHFKHFMNIDLISCEL